MNYSTEHDPYLISMIQRDALRLNKACLSIPSTHPVQNWTRTENLPGDWGTYILLPLHKKGDKTIVSDCGGISLIDIVAKVFSLPLINHITATRHPHKPQQLTHEKLSRMRGSDLYQILEAISKTFQCS